MMASLPSEHVPSDQQSAVAETRTPEPAPGGFGRRFAVRWLALIGILVITIDTLPDGWTKDFRVRQWLNTALGYVGLAQGDWPLFAPNPSLNNETIVAEVRDRMGQEATWRSPDWSQTTAWEKFYRFRYMSFYQRVGDAHYAARDFADYLQRTIPDQEYAKPMIRWSETNEILPPAALVPPMVSVKLYEYREQMVLSDENPMPNQSETLWSQQSKFLVAREYQP